MQRMDPAVPTLLKRGIREGAVNFLRERGWLVSFGAFFGIALLLQILLVTFIGIQSIQSVLRARTDIRLEIQADATDQEIREFLAAVQQLSYVKDVAYITKEQAYERTLKTDPALISFLEEYGLENPFPDSIGVTLNRLQDYDQFSQFIENDIWRTVVDPTFLSEVSDQEDHIYELIRLTDAGQSVTILILCITGLALLCTTTELVRRRALARNDEIMVERLVGAHSLAIIVPFTTEASILLIGSMLASGILLLIVTPLAPSLIPALGTGGVLSSLQLEFQPIFRNLFPQYLIGEVLLSPVVAFAGTWLGIRAKIKSSTLSIRSL